MHKAENSTLTTGPGCSLLFQLGNKTLGGAGGSRGLSGRAGTTGIPVTRGQRPWGRRRPSLPLSLPQAVCPGPLPSLPQVLCPALPPSLIPSGGVPGPEPLGGAGRGWAMAAAGGLYGAWGRGGRAPAVPGPAGGGGPFSGSRPRPRWARAGRAPGHGGLAGWRGQAPAPFHGRRCRQGARRWFSCHPVSPQPPVVLY